MAAQSRTLRNSMIGLAIFFVLVAALLLARARPARGGRTDRDADPRWVAAGVLWSCSRASATWCCSSWSSGCSGRRLSSRLSLSELAVNSVVSVSGLAGIALGAWVLRSKGISVERIAKRSVLIFVLTSAVNVGAVVRDRGADVAGPAAGLAQPAADAAAGGCWRWRRSPARSRSRRGRAARRLRSEPAARRMASR